ncbi:CopG family transcriptional regulator [Mycobacterium malmoense]|uniref:CopG family transcriptional regulator n=1 Tax=Mycobacterium malmoense TaxID=1780 RepID=UPI00210D38D8|nr:CopG family transcriptional regulator [Mycobacterium malmoense]
MSKQSLADRLATVSDEAEAGEEDRTGRPIPAHVKVSQPGRARSKVLQFRLNPEEMAALEASAGRRGLPGVDRGPRTDPAALGH